MTVVTLEFIQTLIETKVCDLSSPFFYKTWNFDYKTEHILFVGFTACTLAKIPQNRTFLKRLFINKKQGSKYISGS